MKYDSLEVASYIAKVCNDLGYSYNNTKIQKLLYCCYGASLVAFDEPICSEYPNAWQYGPVFPQVFHYIRNGNNLSKYPSDQLNKETCCLIEKMVRHFGKYTASQLSDWTHEPGSPWDTVVNKMGVGLRGLIPEGLIKDYFASEVLTVKES